MQEAVRAHSAKAPAIGGSPPARHHRYHDGISAKPHGLALMFPVKGEGVLVGLLADGEQCKALKLHKAGDGAVDDG